MNYSELYIWVEGDDDERFFERVVNPLFSSKYDRVEITQYSQTSKKYIYSYLQSIRQMGADYLFVADLSSAACVTARKQKILSTYTNVEEDRIVVVKEEIESWYLAGLRESHCEAFGIDYPGNTDNLTKEQFISLRPKQFRSKVSFMVEILKCFCARTAEQNNESFRYFMKKYGRSVG